MGINDVAASHGKGDFVISQPGADGRPSADRYVVNGEVFADTYDNRGWTDCLAAQMNSTAVAQKPKELFGKESMTKEMLALHYRTALRHIAVNTTGILQNAGLVAVQEHTTDGKTYTLCLCRLEGMYVDRASDDKDAVLCKRKDEDTTVVRFKFVSSDTLSVKARSRGYVLDATFNVGDLLDDKYLSPRNLTLCRLASHLAPAIAFEISSKLHITTFDWVLFRKFYMLTHQWFISNHATFEPTIKTYIADRYNLPLDFLNTLYFTIKQDSFKQSVSSSNKDIRRSELIIRCVQKGTNKVFAEVPVKTTIDNTRVSNGGWGEDAKYGQITKSLQGKAWMSVDFRKLYPSVTMYVGDKLAYNLGRDFGTMYGNSSSDRADILSDGYVGASIPDYILAALEQSARQMVARMNKTQKK